MVNEPPKTPFDICPNTMLLGRGLLLFYVAVYVHSMSSSHDTEYENSAKVLYINESSIVYTMESGVLLVGATVPTAGVLRKAGGRDY
jgi:hypothetical protein